MATFKYKAYTIHYQLDGDEHLPVLVILNGIMMSHKSWDLFIDDFSTHFQVLRLDMIDQGESSKAENDYTQAIQVDMLKALFDHLTIRKAHVLGISYGGSIALQFAAKYQSSVDKLLLFNIVAKTSDWLKAIGDGWNAVAKTRDGNAYYHITIPYIYSPLFYQERLDWMNQRKELLIPLFSNPEFLDAMIRLTKSAETHDVTASLGSINTPTLVVSGSLDYLTPPFEQETVVKAMPNAHHVIFEGAGHASMYEQPQLFVTTVLGFLLTQKTPSKI